MDGWMESNKPVIVCWSNQWWRVSLWMHSVVIHCCCFETYSLFLDGFFILSSWFTTITHSSLSKLQPSREIDFLGFAAKLVLTHRKSIPKLGNDHLTTTQNWHNYNLRTGLSKDDFGLESFFFLSVELFIQNSTATSERFQDSAFECMIKKKDLCYILLLLIVFRFVRNNREANEQHLSVL